MAMQSKMWALVKVRQARGLPCAGLPFRAWALVTFLSRFWQVLSAVRTYIFTNGISGLHPG